MPIVLVLKDKDKEEINIVGVLEADISLAEAQVIFENQAFNQRLEITDTGAVITTLGDTLFLLEVQPIDREGLRRILVLGKIMGSIQLPEGVSLESLMDD